MSQEYKCVECGKWFDPKEVDHSSAFWRRSDGHNYSRKEYCSVECVGRSDCEWNMAYAKRILPYDDEENKDEAALDTYRE